jgi:selenocysteine-specific elongation factor
LRTAAGRARFARLAESTLRAAESMLDEAGEKGLPTAALVGRLGLRQSDSAMIARTLAPIASDSDSQASARVVDADAAADARPRSRAVLIGDVLVSTSVMTRLGDALLKQVARHHDAQRDSDGLPREEVRERLGVSGRVFEHLVATLVGAGQLVARERLALPGHRVVVGDADAEAAGRVEGAVAAAGLRGPDITELAASLKLAMPVVERLSGLLVRQKRLVRLGTLVFHPDVLARLREEMRNLKEGAPGGRAVVNVASFKTRYDVSRKYAIPLLEYLDRERVTRRVGDERVVL